MPSGPLSDSFLARIRGLLGDRYEFLSLLGQGGGGSVFEVRNLKLGRIEALKILGDDLGEFGARRFAHEAKISASLDHPRIVKVYEFGQDGGLYWYSMQHVDGPSLGMLLEGGMGFDEGMAASLAAPMLDALAYSHERGVVHRDIKPANILINLEGRPFLSDFGIAKSTDNLLKTRTGQMLGTPAYVSPEQALGEAVDARADQYSLGITLYRILAGRLPFTADTMLQTIVLRLKEPPEPILQHRPGMDSGVGAVIMRSLEMDRERRWPDVRAMREALLAACDRAGIPWTTPLSGHAEFQPQRLVLEPENPSRSNRGTVPLARKSYEPTASLVVDAPGRPKTRWRLPILFFTTAAGVAFLGIRSWPRPTPEPIAMAASRPPATASNAKPKIPEPRPAPAPTRVAAVPAQPEAAPSRRVVTYPQLDENQTAFTPRPGCGGVRANVSLRVSSEGKVLSCKLLTEVPADCVQAIRDMAMALRFKPALDAQGQPVETPPFATAITLPPEVP